MAQLLVHPVAGPAILAATCFLVFFLNLGRSAVLDPDEGRCAEIAREMLVSGNWLTPTLNFTPYHDKPILFYWLLALSMKIFGFNEWALRLPSAIAASCGVFATAWWGTRFLGRLTGMSAALILATAGGYVGLGRFILIDSTFSWWMTAAFLYGGAWCLEGRQRGWATWPFYALLSLAMLTKGPVALLLAALTFLAFIWRFGLLRYVKELRIGQGLVILAILAGGWYAATAFVAPNYVWEFLWFQNVERFASGAGGHRTNAFAYMYLLPAIFLPWSLYLPAILIHNRNAHRLRLPRPLEFCAFWFGIVFVFFSLSKGKVATYLLPALVPLAVLTADALAPTLRRETMEPAAAFAQRLSLYFLAALLLASSIAAFVFLRLYAPQDASMIWFLLVGAPPLLLGLFSIRRHRYDLVVSSVFGSAVVYAVAFYFAAPSMLNEVYSLKHPALELALLGQDANVISYQAKGYSLQFYTGRDVRVADSIEAAGEQLSGSKPAALLTKQQALKSLRCHLSKPAYVWWEGERTKAVVVNSPPPQPNHLPATELMPLPPEECGTGLKPDVVSSRKKPRASPPPQV